MIQTIQRTFTEADIRRDFNFILHQGRPAVLVPELEQALGYEPKSLIKRLSNEWAHEMIEGEDFAKVEGDTLVDLKKLLNETGSVKRNQFNQAGHAKSDQFKHTSSITLLYESGFNLVCIKTEKPLGVKLRRWLATEVLPSLTRTGRYSVNDASDSEPSGDPELDRRLAAIQALANQIQDPKLQAKLLLEAGRMMARAPLRRAASRQAKTPSPKAPPKAPHRHRLEGLVTELVAGQTIVQMDSILEALRKVNEPTNHGTATVVGQILRHLGYYQRRPRFWRCDGCSCEMQSGTITTLTACPNCGSSRVKSLRRREYILSNQAISA